MIVDQAEIDALLTQQAASPPAAAAARVAPKSAIVAPPRPATSANPDASTGRAELVRLLRLRVPVIVEMARRTLPISEIRKLSIGTIIEFSKSIESPLTLRIHNRPIGCGEAVKVGEKFGIRVSEIQDAAARIRTMGAK